ncbi:Phage protein [Lachnospiraceae bacterium TWA4]|nr:Phage protein [Lachnospiraceae bacterium TWA4]
MPDKHAVLSASSSHRWLNCPPSALLCAKEIDTPSEFAKQGTDAHTLCEYKLHRALGQQAKNPIENLTFFDEEMDDYSDLYVQYVMEKFNERHENCKDSIVLIEQHLDFSKWVPSGFGTGDCVIVADEVLTVIDLKYGTGILVEAENNSQMMCYALGALELFDGIYDIKSVEMAIFQPRRDHISTFLITKKELLLWAEQTLAPIANLAAKGEGEYKAGSHCQFCKVKATCRKRAEYNLELARYDFKMPSYLEDYEIEMILAKSEELVSWIGDVKDYALGQAISGKDWKGWKLVEGRSNRKYVNEQIVAKVIEEAGYNPYEQKMLGITAMTKMLGKTKFEELLGGLIEKPQGKPTLVPLSDKRPMMKNTAMNDFKEDNDDVK